jgi:glycosyltransferase involved in cell wall biosynthesis
MKSSPSISVIIPFFNAKKHIEACVENVLSQSINVSYEVIMINDGSTDKCEKKLEKYKNNQIKLFSLKSNLGPSEARNLGIKKARGDYLFFLDVDDRIEKNTLSTLHNYIKIKKFDLIFCDRKWIENSKNIRNKKYAYSKNKIFKISEIKKLMERRFYNPLSSVGIFQLTGRLIKRSIIVNNKIYFEKRLRYLEDEAFEWDIIGNLKNAVYVKKQLYSYFLNNNTNTALSRGVSSGFSNKNFEIVTKHVENSLMKKSFSKKEIKRIGDQGYIFLIISSLISITRSILLGKINSKKGIAQRNILIENIFKNKKIIRAIKYYQKSKNESKLIVEAIKLRSLKLLSKACDLRALEVIKIRRNNK